MTLSRRIFLKLLALCGLAPTATSPTPSRAAEIPQPFGSDYPQLDSLSAGRWWEKPVPKGPNAPPALNVPRDQVVAFALYLQDRGTLKLTAQLFPLLPDESRTVRLEFKIDDVWTEVAEAAVVYPGWSAHFRIENHDATRDVPYRVCHGPAAQFDGLIRRDPLDKDVLVIANMSCNSSRTTGSRPEIIENLKFQDPDLLFFGGDQTYRHTEHTAGWIEFGLQFRDIIRDRPTITIPDDHDVGHPNVWGENGKQSLISGNADGGYFYPPEYVNLVQRQQTWHLPDPVDPAPIERGIGVYFTRLRLGGVDFAILEDRKFKTGPAGKIPQQGPRPDHINNPNYDPKSIDLPGLELLGERQLRFLRSWGEDWNGVTAKIVLSQTAFCGAVHIHGQPTNRLLADLDCNGWPQSGRNVALREIRKAGALHLCGDQHLAVVVKHGIEAPGDGPYGFTSPALVNTIYGRWWHPEDEQPGPHAVLDSPLPWTGDYVDGLGNMIRMLAYANPVDIKDERQRADGYCLVRVKKSTRQAVLECWPRFADAKAGVAAQFPGWPLTINFADNDGRKPIAWLPELQLEGMQDPVVQVIHEPSGEVVYTRRIVGCRYRPPVFAEGTYTVKVGHDGPEEELVTGVEGKPA